MSERMGDLKKLYIALIDTSDAFFILQNELAPKLFTDDSDKKSRMIYRAQMARHFTKLLVDMVGNEMGAEVVKELGNETDDKGGSGA